MTHNRLSDLEPWAKSILNSLEPKARKPLLRQMAIALRRENQKRITAQTDPEGQKWPPRRKSGGKAAQKKKMMLGLRKARSMRIKASTEGFSVGFTGSNAKIARIHHYGLRQYIAGRNVQYPKRELLGITTKDREIMQNILITHITNRD